MVTVCTKTGIVYANRPLITVNWHPAQSAFPWIWSRCRISDGMNDRDVQKMVTIHNASGLDGCI